MRILALTKYGREAASTRQRVLQYAPALNDAGFELSFSPLLGDDYVRALADGRAPSRPAIIASYLKRIIQLMRTQDADVIWVYAELLPYLPGIIERLVFRSRIPVVYDLDDAFFQPYEDLTNPLMRRLLKQRLSHLISGADACTCGNAYLQEYASRYNKRAIVIPTVVDTDAYRPGHPPETNPPVIGWIGSPSTWVNVRPLLPLLARLQGAGAARFRVVGAGKAARADSFQGMEVVDWREAREIAEVQSFDVGIMPLLDRPFQRGKSGYKAIQFMAAGRPVIASPVGVNSEIIQHGVTGFLASSSEEWTMYLERLLVDEKLRQSMGASGRERAVAHYSLQSQAPRLVELFHELAGKSGRI